MENAQKHHLSAALHEPLLSSLVNEMFDMNVHQILDYLRHHVTETSLQTLQLSKFFYILKYNAAS